MSHFVPLNTNPLVFGSFWIQRKKKGLTSTKIRLSVPSVVLLVPFTPSRRTISTEYLIINQKFYQNKYKIKVEFLFIHRAGRPINLRNKFIKIFLFKFRVTYSRYFNYKCRITTLLHCTFNFV